MCVWGDSSSKAISSIAIASLSSALIGGKCRKTRSSAKSTYLHKMFLEPPLHKVGSQNFGTIRPMDGYEKSPNFLTLAKRFWYRLEKPHGANSPPPPHTRNRVKVLQIPSPNFLESPGITFTQLTLLSKRFRGDQHF